MAIVITIRDLIKSRYKHIVNKLEQLNNKLKKSSVIDLAILGKRWQYVSY